MTVNGEPSPRVNRRFVSAALALAGWTLILVVASGRRPNDRTWIGLPALDDLSAVVFLAAVVWLLVWSVRTLRVAPKAGGSRSANLISLWAGLALAIAILLVNPSIIERLMEDNPLEIADEDTAEQFEDVSVEPVDFEITATHVYGALLVVASWVALTFWTRRRLGQPTGQSLVGDEQDETSLVVPIDAMVDDLELGSDPRSAVLAAYQRLEAALAAQDRPRRATETPSEHLRRVLIGLTVDRTAFMNLAGLYELARYSDHTITADHRDRAAAALANARDALAAASAR